MSRITLAMGLIAALALPASATAKPAVGQADRQAAHAECKTERGKTKATREAFKAKYHSMSRCVREAAAEEAAAEEDEDSKNAAKTCAGERRSLGTTEFADKYGTNHNKSNAFGRCVSKHVADDDD